MVKKVDKHPRAVTVGELIRVLTELVESGAVDPASTWSGWDDGDIVLDGGYAVESGAYERGKEA